MPHTRGYRYVAHCLCGGSIDARTGRQDEIAFFENLWSKLHRGTEHGPATPRQAAAARARERDREMRHA